jgi:hypothetical protein
MLGGRQTPSIAGRSRAGIAPALNFRAASFIVLAGAMLICSCAPAAARNVKNSGVRVEPLAASPVRGGGGALIPRTVALRLEDATEAHGHIEADANRRHRRKACSENVPVNVQRRSESGWRVVATGTTNDNARYEVALPGRRGKYRTEAESVVLDPAVCERAFSEPRIAQAEA